MYKKILVPMDGSELAECVLPYVEAIALGNNPVEVTFLYVTQPLDVPLTRQEFKTHIESEAKAAAESYLDDLINRQTYKEAAQHRIIMGKVAETIVDYAAEQKMDFIVMATHGRSGISRWVQGSVADKVLHESTIPVWLIRAGGPREIVYTRGQKMRVLVPLDGSEIAEQVLPHVKDLALQFGIEMVDVVLLRVCEPFASPYANPPPPSSSWEVYLEQETRRCLKVCRAYLEQIVQQLERDGLKAWSVTPEGNAAEAIIDYATENAVGLIAMTTHGHTGLSRWALGSIAEKVLRGASSPVFLVSSMRS